MTRERAAIIGAMAYAAVAIVTFGHAANAFAERSPDFPADGVVYVGVMAAVAWPLYWSWEAWS